MRMNKKDLLKKAKMFLKMAEYDYVIIRIIKITKNILTAALFINSAAFGVLILLEMKKLKV